MALTALPPVRRRAYKLFKLAHWLWPALIGLAIVHTKVTRGEPEEDAPRPPAALTQEATPRAPAGL